KPGDYPATARTSNRGSILSELLVEHVEPRHVGQVKLIGHSTLPLSAGVFSRFAARPSHLATARPHHARIAPAPQAAREQVRRLGSRRAFVLSWRTQKRTARREVLHGYRLHWAWPDGLPHGAPAPRGGSPPHRVRHKAR